MAMLATEFISPLIGRILSLLEGEAASFLGAMDEIKKLERKLQSIKAVLEDAERKQLREAAVLRWLDGLRQVMYDADDLVDDVRAEAAERDARRLSPLFLFRKVVFRLQIASRARAINARLEDIAKDRSQLHLSPSCCPHETSHQYRSNWVPSRETSPLVVDSDVLGIDDEANKLVDFLLEDRNGGEVSLLAITGMGGIGKTTLAQKVFNDDRVGAYFDIKIWLCVSQIFTEVNLLKQIVVFAGGSCSESTTRAEIEPIVRDLVRGKRVLLVLDDVWDGNVWDDLLRSFFHFDGTGNSNTRVFITTRNDLVAKQMGVVCYHQMSLMSDEDCWLMLCKIIFGEGCHEEEITRLSDIGMGIVRKCHGLPLAIRTIGGVLRTKQRSRGEWEKVLANQVWTLTGLTNGIAPALYLSYDDLPPPLKQCFVFCSLFPEDFEIFQWDLIQMWIAEGYVKAEGNSEVEHIAEEYYWDLIGRGLLQRLPQYYGAKMCKMHDLLRSLAISLSMNDQLSGKIHISNTSCIRHLSLVNEEKVIIPDRIRKGYLRTLLLYGSLVNEKFLKDVFRKIKHLRVLDLSNTRIIKLPHMVENLVHLRFLSLSSTELTELPESMGHLWNLQTLIIEECKHLCKLPNSIALLNNLCYLSVRGTNLDFLPWEIGNLRNLSTFDGFFVGTSNEKEGDQDRCGMEVLKHLSKLRYLRINKLERVSNVNEAKDAALKDKPGLKCLRLWYSTKAGEQKFTEDAIRKTEEVFEEFCPPKCLEELAIHGFYGRNFPSWMFDLPFPDLQWLRLLNCVLCKNVPSLGKLHQLRVLLLVMPAVVTIGPEFFGTMGRFLSLEQLFFKDMLSWRD